MRTLRRRKFGAGKPPPRLGRSFFHTFFIHPGRKNKTSKKFNIGERELQITFLKAASKRARVSSQSRILHRNDGQNEGCVCRRESFRCGGEIMAAENIDENF
jgi:hypothetical protein